VNHRLAFFAVSEHGTLPAGAGAVSFVCSCFTGALSPDGSVPSYLAATSHLTSSAESCLRDWSTSTLLVASPQLTTLLIERFRWPRRGTAMCCLLRTEQHRLYIACWKQSYSKLSFVVQWRHWGGTGGGPPLMTPSRGWYPNKINFVAEFRKNTG